MNAQGQSIKYAKFNVKNFLDCLVEISKKSGMDVKEENEENDGMLTQKFSLIHFIV